MSDGKQKYIKQKDLIEKLNCENQSEQLVRICENRSRILIYEQKKEIFIVWFLSAKLAHFIAIDCDNRSFFPTEFSRFLFLLRLRLPILTIFLLSRSSNQFEFQ